METIDGIGRKYDDEEQADGTEEHPRYLSHTFSSSLQPFLNAEVERITNSFRPGSCWSLKKLPHKLDTGYVQQLRHVHTTNNLLSKPPQIYKAKTVKKYFGDIKYIPTDYGKCQDLERGAEEVQRVNIESYAQNRPGFFNNSRVKHKCEDIFEDDGYTFPSLGPAPKGIITLQSIVRDNLTDKLKFSCGKFRTDSGDKKMADSKEAIDWANKIFALLGKDWPQLKFKVKLTKRDELLVQFETDVMDVAPELSGPMTKYMNRLATHGLCAELGLRKRGDRWGRFEDVGLPAAMRRSLALEETNSSILTAEQEGEDSFKSFPSPHSQGKMAASGGQSQRSSPSKPTAAPSNIKAMTFSFFLPWAARGVLEASKAAAYADRQTIRKQKGGGATGGAAVTSGAGGAAGGSETGAASGGASAGSRLSPSSSAAELIKAAAALPSLPPQQGDLRGDLHQHASSSVSASSSNSGGAGGSGSRSGGLMAPAMAGASLNFQSSSSNLIHDSRRSSSKKRISQGVAFVES